MKIEGWIVSSPVEDLPSKVEKRFHDAALTGRRAGLQMLIKNNSGFK